MLRTDRVVKFLRVGFSCLNDIFLDSQDATSVDTTYFIDRLDLEVSDVHHSIPSHGLKTLVLSAIY